MVIKREDGCIFNIGGKNDAYLPSSEVEDYENLKIGDRFKVIILKFSFHKTHPARMVFQYKFAFFSKTLVSSANKASASFYKGLGCIKIDREKSDVNAIKTCLKVLACITTFDKNETF